MCLLVLGVFLFVCRTRWQAGCVIGVTCVFECACWCVRACVCAVVCRLVVGNGMQMREIVHLLLLLRLRRLIPGRRVSLLLLCLRGISLLLRRGRRSSVSRRGGLLLLLRLRRLIPGRRVSLLLLCLRGISLLLRRGRR